jgi:phosphoribosyl-ATP pyrophosphohydrolase/phosphoribosyl-AMP cyclohydrolase/histidinol dehydrogenase
MAALRPLVAGFVVGVPGAEATGELVKSLRACAGTHTYLAVQPAGGVTAAEVGRLHRQDVTVVAHGRIPPVLDPAAAAAAAAPPAASADAEDTAGPGAPAALDVGACIASCARSDRPDGLFTTVVSDECGKTLGLVYSSKESVAEAVRCGRGVYYSRSRGGLWRKGDTSGAWQGLRAVRLDCDSDALLFTVKQMGAVPAFCHLNTRTCWGEDGGLSALERTLAARRVDAPPGSYTKRLFDDHQLLTHKLLEEAQELAEAREPDHIAAEAADLIYFALVRFGWSAVLAD